MANISWPSDVPQKPLVDGYQENEENNVIRTQMDQGPDKVRRRTTDNVQNYQMVFRMDDTEKSNWQDWYENTVKHGSLKFDFDDPTDGNTYEWRLVIPPEPQWSSQGGNIFDLRIQMEKLPASKQ